MTGATADATAEVTGATADDDRGHRRRRPPSVTGATADVTAEVTGATAEVTGATADVTAEVTGAAARPPRPEPPPT